MKLRKRIASLGCSVIVDEGVDEEERDESYAFRFFPRMSDQSIVQNPRQIVGR